MCACSFHANDSDIGDETQTDHIKKSTISEKE